jgi:hypothetical protein
MPSPASGESSIPSPPPPTTAASVEYKKDGTVSRMRSHRGNVPQLPQTKLCPFCPAKFTRTTHLNRHLRNRTLTPSFGSSPSTAELTTRADTNERLYRCEVRESCNCWTPLYLILLYRVRFVEHSLREVIFLPGIKKVAESRECH